MKKWKQLLCVALAATTAFGMCACGSKSDNGGTEAKKETETKGALDLEGMSYEEQSQAVYDRKGYSFLHNISERKGRR